MEYELAWALGKTHSEIRGALSPQELVQWIAFLKREPRGERRFDINIGWLVFWMRRCVGDKSVKLEDCVYDFGRAHRDKKIPRTEKNKVVASVFKNIANTFAALKDKKEKKQEKGG